MSLIARLRQRFAGPPPTGFDLPGIGAFDFAVHRHSDLWISEAIRQGHVLEPYVLEMLQAMIRPGDSMLDIGANIGWFSVIGSRLVGARGRVTAIEPSPRNAALARRNLARNGCGNAVLHQCAAGAADGTARLYLSPDLNQGDHQMALATDRPDWTDVRVRAMDSLLPDIARIDVVKLDTQGSEALALAGMRRLIAASPMVRLILEYWPHGLRRCGSTTAELAAMLMLRPSALWLLRNDGNLERITAARMVALAETEYSPASEAHGDIVAVSLEDHELIARLDAR